MNICETENSLITENMGLVHACANRFRGRGIEYEDLFQAGCVGLVKAAAGFDKDRGFQFSTYAVPAILGEIRRIFRDGGTVKIGRAAKEKAREMMAIREELSTALDREPTVNELAEKCNMDPAEAGALLSASLPIISLTNEEGENQTDIPVPAPDEKLNEQLDLFDALKKLDENEKILIELRYFKGQTQCRTAEVLGLSQVQVSRKEKSILKKLKLLLS